MKKVFIEEVYALGTSTLRQAFGEFEATFPYKEKKVQEGQLVDDCMKNPNEQ